MTEVIRNYEAKRAKRHPVLISAVGPFGNDMLYESPADAIAPAWRDTPVPGIPEWNHWLDDPPATDGRKVLIMDTDHGAFLRFHEDLPRARAWAWKAFT